MVKVNGELICELVFVQKKSSINIAYTDIGILDKTLKVIQVVFDSIKKILCTGS